jgi:hypothetical protein
MVRQVAPRPTATWKALLALGIASGALLWHILACTESPMAFSPDGKRLAFVTMEPYAKDDSLLVAGARVFRLMALSDRKDLHVIEATTGALLSAPGYSPDGRRLAYFRIPLLTEEGVARLQAFTEAQRPTSEPQEEFAWGDYAAALLPVAPNPSAGATGRPAPETAGQPNAECVDATLPPAELVALVTEGTRRKGMIPAELVLRDASTYALESRTPVALPWGGDELEPLGMLYLTARPEFGPDGATVYACLGYWVEAIDLRGGAARLLAVAESSTLSPEGNLVAVTAGPVVGFVRVDGSAATYRRLPESITRGGLVWLAPDRLAVLTTPRNRERGPDLYVLRADGTMLNSTTLPARQVAHDWQTGELAVARDGRHMVAAYDADVFFLDGQGRLLKHWQGDDERILAQPTFSPDSKSLAMKCLEKVNGSYQRVAAVVFFTPEGEETAHAAIPRIDPAATQPAASATQPVGKQ